MSVLSIRRAAVAGLAVSLVLSAAIAAQSAKHLEVFAYVLFVTLAVSSATVALLLVIDRSLRHRRMH